MRAALGFTSPIEVAARLAKIRVSGLAALAAATGRILGAGDISGGTIASALTVFAMACGSCALNQLQERRIDKLMRRTKGRPIPAVQVRPRSALFFALLCMAAGGSLSDPRILALMLFMFIWQVPHFWLLMLNNREDYELAGLPSVTGVFTSSQLGRLSFTWIAAAAVSPLLIPGLRARCGKTECPTDRTWTAELLPSSWIA